MNRAWRGAASKLPSLPRMLNEYWLGIWRSRGPAASMSDEIELLPSVQCSSVRTPSQLPMATFGVLLCPVQSCR